MMGKRDLLYYTYSNSEACNSRKRSGSPRGGWTTMVRDVMSSSVYLALIERLSTKRHFFIVLFWWFDFDKKPRVFIIFCATGYDLIQDTKIRSNEDLNTLVCTATFRATIPWYTKQQTTLMFLNRSGLFVSYFHQLRNSDIKVQRASRKIFHWQMKLYLKDKMPLRSDSGNFKSKYRNFMYIAMYTAF